DEVGVLFLEQRADERDVDRHFRGRRHDQSRIILTDDMLFNRRRLVGLLAVLFACALGLVGRWFNATKAGGEQPAVPFRIIGNFYYVGANDVSAFLITGPEGHVVLDGGYPSTARLIMASIAKLGFDIKDVKVLVNSEPHADHAGGLTVLQQASGAQLWAS